MCENTKKEGAVLQAFWSSVVWECENWKCDP